MSTGNPLIDARIPSAIVELVPLSLAIHYAILPMKRQDNILKLAYGRPLDDEDLEKLEWILEVQIVAIPFPEEQVQQAIEFYSGGVEEVVSSF